MLLLGRQEGLHFGKDRRTGYASIIGKEAGRPVQSLLGRKDRRLHYYWEGRTMLFLTGKAGRKGYSIVGKEGQTATLVLGRKDYAICYWDGRTDRLRCLVLGRKAVFAIYYREGGQEGLQCLLGRKDRWTGYTVIPGKGYTFYCWEGRMDRLRSYYWEGRWATLLTGQEGQTKPRYWEGSAALWEGRQEGLQYLLLGRTDGQTGYAVYYWEGRQAGLQQLLLGRTDGLCCFLLGRKEAGQCYAVSYWADRLKEGQTDRLHCLLRGQTEGRLRYPVWEGQLC